MGFNSQAVIEGVWLGVIVGLLSLLLATVLIALFPKVLRNFGSSWADTTL